MHIRIPESVSNQLFCCGFFEPGLTSYIMELVRPGDVVVDVGAHFGYFTLLAADLVGDLGQVHAFEPTPSTFLVLEKNIGCRSNVVANPMAVWEERRQTDVTDLGVRLSAYNSMFRPRLSGRELRKRASRQISVEAVSLDDYCIEKGLRPSFVKVDAESSESHIVKGMKRLLAELRPLVTIEVGDYGIPGIPSSSELIEGVISYGYVAFDHTRGAIGPHKPRDHYGYDNILFAPREHPLCEAFDEWSL